MQRDQSWRLFNAMAGVRSNRSLVTLADGKASAVTPPSWPPNVQQKLQPLKGGIWKRREKGAVISEVRAGYFPSFSSFSSLLFSGAVFSSSSPLHFLSGEEEALALTHTHTGSLSLS